MRKQVILGRGNMSCLHARSSKVSEEQVFILSSPNSGILNTVIHGRVVVVWQSMNDWHDTRSDPAFAHYPATVGYIFLQLQNCIVSACPAGQRAFSQGKVSCCWSTLLCVCHATCIMMYGLPWCHGQPGLLDVCVFGVSWCLGDATTHTPFRERPSVCCVLIKA